MDNYDINFYGIVKVLNELKGILIEKDAIYGKLKEIEAKAEDEQEEER